LLSRIKSFEGGEETVFCGLREAFNKLVQPVSWQTFFGYITKGCKTGEYAPLQIVSNTFYAGKRDGRA
jgi:hypothetical protein